MKQRTDVRSVYAVPQVEVYAQEPCYLPANSIFSGGAGEGDLDADPNSGGGAGNGNLEDVNGAKKLGFFEFRDPWEI